MRNRKEIDPEDLWTDFGSGASFRTIAGKYGMNHSTLASRLRRADKKRYREMMRRRRGRSTWFKPVTSRWKRRIKATLIPRIWNDLETSSATLRQIAEKYGIKYTSLTRWLLLIDKRRYLRIVRERMKRPRRRLPMVSSAIWSGLESGKLLKEVSDEFGIDRRTLGYRLSRIDKDRYRRIVKQRPHKLRFGSLEAKRQGADSLFELNVRKLLAKSGVKFEFHAKLRLDRHLYKPDFLLRSANVILEVAGITIRSYWKHMREKTRRYVKYGYILLVIVPGTSLYKKAEHYLLKNDRIRIVQYSQFKNEASEYMKSLKRDI